MNIKFELSENDKIEYLLQHYGQLRFCLQDNSDCRNCRKLYFGCICENEELYEIIKSLNKTIKINDLTKLKNLSKL